MIGTHFWGLATEDSSNYSEARSFKVTLCLLSIRRHLSPAAFVFDLLVRVRPPSGSEVQEGPHRLHRADMPWILPRLGRHEQQFGGPAQPDHPVRALVEHGEDRHLLPLLILAMIVAFEAVVGG
jgi:hypothetical protein